MTGSGSNLWSDGRAEYVSKVTRPVWTFTVPSPTASLDLDGFQRWVSDYALAAQVRPVEGAVGMETIIFREMPEEWTNQQRGGMGGKPATGGQTVATIETAIHNALRGIAYAGEDQITRSAVSRVWAWEHRIVITIYGVGE